MCDALGSMDLGDIAAELLRQCLQRRFETVFALFGLLKADLQAF